jgi:hypothetical protein
MITLTGFTNDDFNYLLAKFAPVYDEYSPFVDEDGSADNNLLTYDEQIQDLAIKREATSMCQSAEWGMRGVQSSFPQSKDTLQFKENSERNVIVSSLL